MAEEKPVTQKGKQIALGGLVIGCVALLFALVPFFSSMALMSLVGCLAIYFAVPCFLFCLIGFFLARANNNPNRKFMIVGMSINVVAMLLSVYWFSVTLS